MLNSNNKKSVGEFVQSYFKSSFLFFSAGPMKWGENHDILLAREILVIEPFSHKIRNKERGLAWDLVAQNLNSLLNPIFNVNQRSVRDRFKLLEKRFKDKEREEQKGSGISSEESELDAALEDIISKTIEADEINEKLSQEKKENIENEKSAAEEMRRRSLETFGETQKRKGEKVDIEGKKAKRSRSSGSEVLVYLKEWFRHFKSYTIGIRTKNYDTV